MTPQYAPLLAPFVTLLVTTILLYGKVGKEVPQEPLANAPVPRIGGVGLMAGIFTAAALMLSSLAWWMALPLLGLFAVAMVEETRGLPVKLRLLAHVAAACVVVFGSGLAQQNIIFALLVVFAVIWMINLYDLMDGPDGLAGGMTFFGFTMYGLAALMREDHIQALLNFSIGSAALGFLYYNFFPAKVHMGRVGAIPLGFMAGAMGVWGWQQGHWPAWFPFLVFSPFIVDASVTVLKRMLSREKPWLFGAATYFQRLRQLGWEPPYVALLGYALMAGAGISAVWAMRRSAEFPWEIFLLWSVIYALLMLALDQRWKIFLRNSHS
ncbi:MAG: glycosyl transferase family 4 [Pseudomonadota bacterium]